MSNDNESFKMNDNESFKCFKFPTFNLHNRKKTRIGVVLYTKTNDIFCLFEPRSNMLSIPKRYAKDTENQFDVSQQTLQKMEDLLVRETDFDLENNEHITFTQLYPDFLAVLIQIENTPERNFKNEARLFSKTELDKLETNSTVKRVLQVLDKFNPQSLRPHKV